MKKILESNRLFIVFSLIVGVLVFISIYGTMILNPFYTDWTMRESHDFSQHYLGRLFFKNSPWQFPLGMFDSLSYPDTASIFFMDTVPLFTVIFKVFTTIFNIKEDCQFYGIYGLMCFMLHGLFGFLISKRFLNSKKVALLCSLIFILVPAMIDKMFWQCAVASHWLFLFALCICVYYDNLKNNRKKLYSLWALLGFLCAGVHTYITVFCGMLLVCFCIYDFYFLNEDNKLKKFVSTSANLISFCIPVLLSFWVFGVFDTKISEMGWGFGDYNANLNSLFNPYDSSSVLNQLQDVKEGYNYGYLGFGTIILALISIACLLVNFKKTKATIKDNNITIGLYFLLLISSLILSALPVIAWGETILFNGQLPHFIEKIMQMFRANDRFVFVADYLILVSIIWILSKSVKEWKIAIIVFSMLCLQVYDLSDYFSKKHNLYNKKYKYSSVLTKNPELKRYAKDKKFLYTNETHEYEVLYELAYFANKNNLSLSSFYFSRNIQKEIDVLQQQDFLSNAIFVYPYESNLKNNFNCEYTTTYENYTICVPK